MSKNTENPLHMVRDPIAGDAFVFPPTKCTPERRLFFKRANEIQALLFITKHAYDQTHRIYLEHIQKWPEGGKTRIRLELNTGNCVMFPAGLILGLSSEGINILTRQAFVMFYGSFETYLFQLLGKAYAAIGVEDRVLDRSIELLMGGKWDRKFNRLNKVFGIDFKAGDLRRYFSGFELHFEGQVFKYPLDFMDELAKVRHKIVHAASILENGQLIAVDLNMLHSLYGFYFLLTDFVDSLFAVRFNFPRPEINPAEV